MTALRPAQRREAGLALAMLPVGVVVMVASALALVSVALLMIAAPFRGGAWWWTELWALAAAAVALRNMLAGIAITAAFDWRPLPLVLVSSIAIAATWPGWWLD